MSVAALVLKIVAVSLRRTGWRRNQRARPLVTLFRLEFPRQANPGGAAVLLDRLLEVLLRHRVRVLRVEQVPQTARELPGASERLHQSQVDGGCRSHVSRVEFATRIGPRKGGAAA